jgi:tRNA (guanine37-N1)-methyltransferase
VSPLRVDVLTLFPEMCAPPLSHSILGRACQAGLLEVGLHDIREHGHGKHRQVDDTPYGGGSGMVMRVDVVHAALEAVRTPATRVLLMDPAGRRFAQADARRLAQEEHLVFLCGHYEGIDSRVREHLVDEALSIGDYVLTGGELPALVMIDAISRMIPGVLGNPESLAEESFTDGLLEGPVFTRPFSYEGWDVPEVLRSGHHGRIQAWRREQALARTRAVRPDLLPGDPPGEG